MLVAAPQVCACKSQREVVTTGSPRRRLDTHVVAAGSPTRARVRLPCEGVVNLFTKKEGRKRRDRSSASRRRNISSVPAKSSSTDLQRILSCDNSISSVSVFGITILKSSMFIYGLRIIGEGVMSRIYAMITDRLCSSRTRSLRPFRYLCVTFDPNQAPKCDELKYRARISGYSVYGGECNLPRLP